MLQSVKNPYPGDAATAEQLLQLATEYRTAAHTLRSQSKKGKPLSRAPCRLAAIHAIELYLNSLLLRKGMESAKVRSFKHGLVERGDLAAANGLHLKRKTCSHLEAMTGSREYLITRYGPEMTASMSEINRLMATLDEVGNKVSVIVAPQG